MSKLKVEFKNFYQMSIDEKNHAILSIVADPYCISILKSIKKIPKSSVDINMDTRIPISTVYRKIQDMQNLKFLKITGNITSDGKKIFLYQSKIKSIEAKFDDKLEVNIEFF